jgi:hypothetical protein
MSFWGQNMKVEEKKMENVEEKGRKGKGKGRKAERKREKGK